MIKIKQTVGRKVIYEAEIKNYNYSIPTFINNGATKITIEYPTSKIELTPVNPPHLEGE